MSSNKNMQSIFLYSFKTMLIIIIFNFVIITMMSKLVFNKFYFSSQNELFSNIFNKIEELEELDVSSDEFSEIINACRYSNCTIEVYDSSENKRLYSPYRYDTDIFASTDSKPIFDEIIGEGNKAIVLNGITGNMEDQQAINNLNGQNNAYSLLIRYSDNIYILIQTSMEVRNNYQSMLFNIILWTTVLSFILGIFLTYFLSRNMMLNILSVKNVAEKISSHDFSDRCHSSKFSEFFELGMYINKMADSLESQMDKIETQNMALAEDIERRKKLEISQKEFISNVSHELKTPISIVSGYAEGIKYGLTESENDRNKYCDTIINECTRMKNIVKQLLDLSKLENNSLNIKQNDVSKLLHDICERFSTKCPERNFVLDFKDGLLASYDSDEIEHVITNYIENAVKYSNEEISIRARDTGNYVHIGILSHGNIDKNDQERIWERFYRADKSHKRKENSTGLGLSIVKTTMEKHKMPFGVNVKNNIIEFYIELKK